MDQPPPAELRRILRLVIGELQSAGSRRPEAADDCGTQIECEYLPPGHPPTVDLMIDVAALRAP